MLRRPCNPSQVFQLTRLERVFDLQPDVARVEEDFLEKKASHRQNNHALKLTIMVRHAPPADLAACRRSSAARGIQAVLERSASCARQPDNREVTSHFRMGGGRWEVVCPATWVPGFAVEQSDERHIFDSFLLTDFATDPDHKEQDD
jgi:hypothetical protein